MGTVNEEETKKEGTCLGDGEVKKNGGGCLNGGRRRRSRQCGWTCGGGGRLDVLRSELVKRWKRSGRNMMGSGIMSNHTLPGSQEEHVLRASSSPPPCR